MRNLIAKLFGVKPGPLSHFQVSAEALSLHYGTSDEKLYLVATPDDESFDVPVIKGRWPRITAAATVQDPEGRDVVQVDIETDRYPGIRVVTHFADPGEILVLAVEVQR